MLVARWQEDGSAGVGGDGDLPMQLLQRLLPLADNEAVGRLVGGVDVETVLDGKLWF